MDGKWQVTQAWVPLTEMRGDDTGVPPDDSGAPALPACRTAEGDPFETTDAWFTETVRFDLAPLREAYAARYDTHGTTVVHVDEWALTLTF